MATPSVAASTRRGMQIPTDTLFVGVMDTSQPGKQAFAEEEEQSSEGLSKLRFALEEGRACLWEACDGRALSSAACPVNIGL